MSKAKIEEGWQPPPPLLRKQRRKIGMVIRGLSEDKENTESLRKVTTTDKLTQPDILFLPSNSLQKHCKVSLQHSHICKTYFQMLALGRCSVGSG